MKNIYTTLRVYLLIISVFFVLRIILLINSYEKLGSAYNGWELLQSFAIGLRFDTVIASYILLIPFLFMFLSSFIEKQDLITSIVKYTLKVLIGLALFIAIIDIPYFNQFFSRLSIMAITWVDSPIFVVKMIIGEPKYSIFIILFALLLILTLKILGYIFKVHKSQPKKAGPLFLDLGISILFIGLLLLGIRGRIEKKSPIRVGTAYFSNNPFLNQLGLNPNFTFLRSYLDSKNQSSKPVYFVSDLQAFNYLKSYYPIHKDARGFYINRQISPTSKANMYNIVLVLMESMSAGKMKRHGSVENLTPFLDSLINRGYYFENNYSAGIHTFNGVYSTLFSYPAVFKQHPMKPVEILNYNGIIKELRNNSYHTLYFTSHDGQFDNIEGFLKANNFDEIVSQHHYPPEKVVSAMGVPDDYLFEYAVTKLNKLQSTGKPFFATILTGSDHGPYHVPSFFKSPLKDIKQRVVQYADYSLKKFITLAEKESWYENTIFVFVGDHGAAMDLTYEASLSYNHVPLLFYAPNIIKEPRSIEDMSLQIDIMPTLMGLLNIPYTNNTLGIDLFKQKRPYGYFNADDKYGVINKDWYLIVREDKSTTLHKYKDKNQTNLSNKYPNIVDSMRNYAESNLQAYQYIIKNKRM